MACPAGQGANADASAWYTSSSSSSSSSSLSLSLSLSLTTQHNSERCPANTFSDGVGIGCLACPHGTKPLAALGATGCDDGDCQYRSADNALFDLRPLRRDKFYGPVIVDEHTYVVVCSPVVHPLFTRHNNIV
jgi:hypothetical protein